MERRRDRYMIIYGWQQLKGVREIILNLKLSNREGSNKIQIGAIRYYKNGGVRILPRTKTQILNIPARRIERLFNPEMISLIFATS